MLLFLISSFLRNSLKKAHRVCEPELTLQNILIKAYRAVLVDIKLVLDKSLSGSKLFDTAIFLTDLFEKVNFEKSQQTTSKA